MVFTGLNEEDLQQMQHSILELVELQSSNVSNVDLLCIVFGMFKMCAFRHYNMK